MGERDKVFESQTFAAYICGETAGENCLRRLIFGMPKEEERLLASVLRRIANAARTVFLTACTSSPFILSGTRSMRTTALSTLGAGRNICLSTTRVSSTSPNIFTATVTAA